MCERFASTAELLAYFRHCTEEIRLELGSAGEPGGADRATAEEDRGEVALSRFASGDDRDERFSPRR